MSDLQRSFERLHKRSAGPVPSVRPPLPLERAQAHNVSTIARLNIDIAIKAKRVLCDVFKAKGKHHRGLLLRELSVLEGAKEL